MKRAEVRKVLRRHGSFCEWCGVGLRAETARVVERRPAPVPFCGTCWRRYEDPDQFPYLRQALTRKGL